MQLGRWLDAHEVERAGRVGPRGALLSVVLVYLLGFGVPIYAAVMALVLAHGHRLARVSPGWNWHNLLELGLNAVAVVVALVLLRREAPTWARPVRRGPRWVAELQAFGLGLVAILAGGTTLALVAWLTHPGLHNNWSGSPGIVAALLAGPAEETVVLVVPVVFLRAARWAWWAVIPAMLALRLAYHVYYGFPVVGFSVWAVAMIFIYLRTHAAIGLILAHSYWDTTLMLAPRWPLVTGTLMSVTLLTLLVWGIVSLILWLVRLSDRRAAKRHAAALPVGWYQNSSGHWWWWDGRRWIAPAPPTDYTFGNS